MALYPINFEPYLETEKKYIDGFEQSYDNLGRAQSFWIVSVVVSGSIDKAEVGTTTYSYQYSVKGVSNAFMFILRYKKSATDNYYSYMHIIGMGDGLKGGQINPYYTANHTILCASNFTDIEQISNQVGTWTSQFDSYVNINYKITDVSDLKNSGLYADFLNKMSSYYLYTNNIGDDSEMSGNKFKYFYFADDIPLFDASNPDAILSYIQRGDTSGAVKKYNTDWTLYVDGITKPLLKLVWRCNVLEKMHENSEIDLNEVFINIFTIKDSERVILATLPYTESYYNTSYMDILQKGDPATYAEIIENVLRPVTINAGDLRFELVFDAGKSAVCYALIPIKNDVVYYGILDGEEDDGSTVTIIYGSGANDDGYITPEDDSDVSDETGSGDGYNSLGLLSTTYALTNARLQALGAFMWGDLMDSIKLVNNNPIENIVSCKIVPTLITGTAKEIVLGNVPTNVNGDVIEGNIKITLGSIAVSEHYNSFLDFAPYTKLTIFLPFIGFKELDTTLFMGKTLKVEYIIDLITGSCKALLYANNIYCQSFDGSCGIDVPITANNRAQVENSYIIGALGAVGDLATGNIGGAISGALSTAQTQYHYSTKGIYNPSCGAFETRLCYLIYDRPTFQKPSSYSHDIGNPCNLTSKLSSLKGFTKCAKNIDLSGVQCTQAEKEEIYKLLTNGIYL